MSLTILKLRPIHLHMGKQQSKKKKTLILIPLIIHSVKSSENECTTERQEKKCINRDQLR